MFAPRRFLGIVAAASSAAGFFSGLSSARAGELEPASLAVVIAHGDASIEVTAEALGLEVRRDGGAGAVTSVAWDGARFAGECRRAGDSLGLLPAFEGDLEIGDEVVEPVYPAPGEALDCATLALWIEQSLANTALPRIEAPLMVREPSVSRQAVDALASDVRALLAGPVTLEITYGGAVAGEITISPDDVRRALRIEEKGAPVRLEAALKPGELQAELEPVLASLGGAARDAELVVDAEEHVHVAAGRRGARVSGAELFGAAVAAAKKPEKKAAAAATKGEPAVSTKKAEALQIKGLVASFTTKHPCCQPRVTNIHRIATLLDGAVVDAGDRFSVNRHVGQRTKKRGFVVAPSIGEGELVQTVGGGVSQVTTTLYNAVFDAGYAVVSRKPHTFYFPRYPLGVEATLSYPRPDFVFRNDSKAGVLVKTSFTDESVTVKLYGDNEGRKVKRFVSKQFDSTDPRIDYEPDESMALDKTKVKETGTQGFSVKAGRDIVFADGTKKHEERTVIYHGKPRVVVAHPCAIPKGEKGHKKKGCPKVDPAAADKDAAVADDKSATAKGAADKGSTDKGAADKGSTDKAASDKAASDKGAADKTTVVKASVDKGAADKADTKPAKDAAKEPAKDAAKEPANVE